MNELVYSPIVKKKMLSLRDRLSEHFDPDTAKKYLPALSTMLMNLKLMKR